MGAYKNAKDNENVPENDRSVPPHRPRKFLIQPIETSSRSSNNASSAATSAGATDKYITSNTSETSSQTRKQSGGTNGRRILPQPIETSTTSRPGPSRPITSPPPPQQQKSPSHTSSPRRFKPDLIATDYRSVKGKVAEHSYHGNAQPLPAENSKGVSLSSLSPRRNTSPHLSESRFSYASLLRRQETRRHSFRVPDLPSIPSNSSEDSDETSSPLSSSSPSKQPRKSITRKPDVQLPEGYNGELSEYLLSLAARSAQKQLKEQALAAFPNEQVYEPVDHFGIDEEDVDSEGRASIYPQTHHLKSRRQSSADLSWELEYMRQHKEEAEQRLRAMVTSRAPKKAPIKQYSRPKPRGPSPPMLGGDIVLPWSLSPDGTLCENTHTDKESQSADDRCTDCGGLWCAATQGDGGRGTGLWMGTCQKATDSEEDPHIFSGIKTPMLRDECEPELQPSTDRSNLSIMPEKIESHHGISPNPSKSLSDEFHDGFVTQIYNYVSLGYPCVARDYDQELSRISGVSVEELRKDDQKTDARGYVVAPADDHAEIACMRWQALRLYIREWVRQQPSMIEEETGLEAWGMPERKGSWAI